MWSALKELYKYDKRFKISTRIFLVIVLFMCLSAVSPYDPRSNYVTPVNLAPTAAHPFGTTSKGQDVFWNMTFALRNSFFISLAIVIVTRIIAFFIGTIAGYMGGIVDSILMTIDDSFIILPILPILIFLKLILGRIDFPSLILILSLFGWAWDARLVRSIVLTLREREFSYTSFFSGRNTIRTILKEYLPHLYPILLATGINNMIWSLGMETTISTLGLTAIDVPTVGTTIFWALQHQAFVAGIWWWIVFPVIFVVLLFLSLYFLSVSLSEFIDPRLRTYEVEG
ncbi:MAG TPA: ABC transporter permease [Dictyoglomaceae bacterium]|nr:ABC transporter permease [Dictyoglomaceae bacterium]